MNAPDNLDTIEALLQLAFPDLQTTEISIESRKSDPQIRRCRYSFIDAGVFGTLRKEIAVEVEHRHYRRVESSDGGCSTPEQNWFFVDDNGRWYENPLIAAARVAKILRSKS